MEIVNKFTGLTKVLDKTMYSVFELNVIYSFYAGHKNFYIIIDGEVD